MVILVIVGLVMALGAILFAFQNSAIVTISLGVWQFQQSLAIVLLITLGVGIILSLLLSVPTIIKRGLQSAKQKKKIKILETQLQEWEHKYARQEILSDSQKRNTYELLTAFNLNDSVTELLNKDTAIELTNHLLEQMKHQSHNTRYSSLCVFLLSVDPAKASRNLIEESSLNSIYKAIANRLRNTVSADTFVAITEKRRFICLTPGLAGQKANDYGKYIQDHLIESPLQKADGSTMNLEVSIGGVIVDPDDAVDSRHILKQAEQNLETALEEKGRNNLILSEIVTKTL